MALTSDEQEFYDWARAAVPKWLFVDGRSEEEINAFLKMFDAARTQIVAFVNETLIKQASGIWLTQHALDRGSDRQNNETDVGLRARLTEIEDALTRATVLAAAQSVWDSNPLLSGTVVIVELRRERFFFRTATSDSGTGGVFTGPDASDVMTFVPTAGLAGAPPFDNLPGLINNSKVTFASCEEAGNDGTFAVTGISGDGITYVNASGVANPDDTTGTWVIKKYDASDNLLDGFQEAYLSRGHRLSSGPPNSFVIILPYDADALESDRQSVVEAMRQKKAAGNPVIVERRVNP